MLSELMLAAIVMMQGQGGEFSWNVVDFWRSLSTPARAIAILLVLAGGTWVLVAALRKKNGK